MSASALSEEDTKLLESIAKRIVRMRMAVPAVFFLESAKPLSFVGSQALVFMEPIIKAFLTIPQYSRFTRLMEERENVERLIQAVEKLDREQQAVEKELRRKEKEEKKARKEARVMSQSFERKKWRWWKR